MFDRLKTAAACAFAVVIAGCGGGGGEPVGDTVDSGTAQKGPLAQGSVVTVDELSSTTLQPSGKQYTFRTNNNLGTFSTTGITFSSRFLSTLALGYYFNEITGTQSSDIVVLAGLSQIGTGGDTVINVNALSSMAVNRVTTLATVAPRQIFAAARAQAQKELLASFYVHNGTTILTGTTVANVAQPANLTALDLSKSRAGDQILAAMSGVVMSAGTNGNGVNTLLSQIAVDLGDDGLLNNSPNYTPSVGTQLCAAAAATDFSVVAANLNRIYGSSYTAASLSQWVDTSGCVDKVINKFKFTARDIAVGTESKSPAYVAGPDDVGQCFSVGGVSTGATAKLYYKASTTAVAATQKVVLGDSLTVGVSAGSAGTYSAFIQRSAPSASGVCPTTVPTSGVVRTQKYTGTFTNIEYIVSTLAGSGEQGSANGTGTTASFSWPYSIATDSGGNIYVGDWNNNTIRRITAQGIVSTLAGSGIVGSTDGPALSATFNRPSGIAVDSNGTAYVADFYNNKIRKITSQGVVSTLAGNGQAGSTNGTGTTARFYWPRGLAVDANGYVYVADETNHQIRKIDPAGTVSVVAGTGAVGSKDGSASTATFSDPSGVAVDSSGNLYVADTRNNKIRKISAQGVVSTLAGSGQQGSADGAGASASFSDPGGIAVDNSGNVYVADSMNNKIRKITPLGVVSTLAGTGEQGSTDGASGSAKFSYPFALAVDAGGTLYVADVVNNKVRKITPTPLTSGLMYISYAYSANTPVAHEAWANDSMSYMHTAANRPNWGPEVKTTDIKGATQITGTTAGSNISIARGSALNGMKVDITVTGFVQPWSTVMFNYNCLGNTCTVGDAWSETPGVTVSVKLTP